MKLDVYVDGSPVGTLEQADITSYVFSYAPGVEEGKMVSLTMPPSAKQTWEHRFLHPVFQVSLPEGALRQVLTRSFAKQFENFGDTELLATVGSHLIGRIKVARAGTPLNEDAPVENLRELLSESTEEMLEHYLNVHAQYSGVSGGFTKFLAKSPVNGEGARTTFTFDNWIIKANDPDHPDLVLNEFFSMRVAQQMGLPTPEMHLSDDAGRLAVRRFDFDDKGGHYGFEDMCALNALNADQKFSGSVERVIKSINAFCQPAEAKKAREQFFAHYLACMAIRNGDAHLKNFGLLYTRWEDVHLAPVFDMVSMSAYAPKKPNGDVLDEPAMSFGGVRRWPDEKAVHALAARCTVAPAAATEIAQRLCDAMRKVSAELVEMARERESFQPMAKRMLEIWSHGTRVHDDALGEHLAGMAREIGAQPEIFVKRARERA